MPINIVNTPNPAIVEFSSPQEIIISQADDSIAVYGTDGTTNRQLKTDTSGRLQPGVFSSIASVTAINSSASSVTLLSSNSSRQGAVFYNNSTQICYVKFGTTASSIDFTIVMDSKAIFIIDSNPIYTGRLDGIWASANGTMQVTELT